MPYSKRLEITDFWQTFLTNRTSWKNVEIQKYINPYCMCARSSVTVDHKSLLYGEETCTSCKPLLHCKKILGNFTEKTWVKLFYSPNVFFYDPLR